MKIRFLILTVFISLMVSPLFSQQTNLSFSTPQVNTNQLTEMSAPSDSASDLYEISVEEFNSKKENIIKLAYQKKNPFTAGLLSFFYSGAGQFYNADYSLGSLFFLGESVYYLLFYGMRIKFQNTYGTTIGFTSMNPSDQILIIGSLALYLGLKYISVANAYQSAVDYNREIDEKLDKINLYFTATDLTLSYSLRF